MAALRVEVDYEALLIRANGLRDRCERDIGVIVNIAQLSQATPDMSETKRNLKLAIIAAMFLPMTATSTFFGMNFVNFGSSSEGVWVWLLTTVPLVVVSLVAIAWDLYIMRKIKKPK